MPVWIASLFLSLFLLKFQTESNSFEFSGKLDLLRFSFAGSGGNRSVCTFDDGDWCDFTEPEKNNNLWYFVAEKTDVGTSMSFLALVFRIIWHLPHLPMGIIGRIMFLFWYALLDSFRWVLLFWNMWGLHILTDIFLPGGCEVYQGWILIRGKGTRDS